MADISALTGTGASGNSYSVQNTKGAEAKAMEPAQSEEVETEDVENSQQEEDSGTIDTEV